MKRIILKKGEEKRILAGHPWVYGNEVLRIADKNRGAELAAGETADIESEDKTYLGRAIVNPASKIIARIYSPSKEGLDKGFFKRRFREAADRRTQYDFSHESARLVFADADFLPGLIIDRYVGWTLDDAAQESERPLSFEKTRGRLGDPRSWLAVQFLTFGMDCRKDMILAAVEEAYPRRFGAPSGIIEKDEAKARELEGLPLREGVMTGAFPENGIVIFENGAPFAVHLVSGQKTGYFLDQKENRGRAASFVRDAVRESGAYRVLDACSYTGGFGITACRAGASKAVCLDISGTALETLKKNAALNGVEDRIAVMQDDVFGALRYLERVKERFDMVILDPPAFAKNRAALEDAVRGYKEINLRAMKLLAPNGVLVTCSCSQALDEYHFRRIIAEAARDAHRRLYQLDFRHQPPDHPVLIGYDESLYLKAGFFRVES
ncbi:MAG: class I SAM-dependent rRNA methyltransferase [Treponema sp.]|jgi:23S rRNA (cytosine1962-C5)-methyltransferase|nr:class I SAM-dependent rRNA methyltransferase [Treponema sp.]